MGSYQEVAQSSRRLHRATRAQPDDGHLPLHHGPVLTHHKVHVGHAHVGGYDADWDALVGAWKVGVWGVGKWCGAAME